MIPIQEGSRGFLLQIYVKAFFSSQPFHFSYCSSISNHEQSFSDLFFSCRYWKLLDWDFDYPGLQVLYGVEMLVGIFYPWLIKSVRHFAFPVAFVSVLTFWSLIGCWTVNIFLWFFIIQILLPSSSSFIPFFWQIQPVFMQIKSLD